MRADAERGGVGCSDLAVEHELVQVEGATVPRLVVREAVLASVFLHEAVDLGERKERRPVLEQLDGDDAAPRNHLVRDGVMVANRALVPESHTRMAKRKKKVRESAAATLRGGG